MYTVVAYLVLKGPSDHLEESTVVFTVISVNRD